MLHDWFFCQSVYSEQECAELFDIAKNNPSKVYSDRHGKMNGKNVDVTVVETKVFGDKLDLFFNVVYGVNEEVFGFKLFPNRPLGLTLNNYSIGQEYPFHKDHSNN